MKQFRDFKLKNKILFVTIMILVGSAVIVGGISIYYTIYSTNTDIADFEKAQFKKKKLELKNMADTAYTIVERSYKYGVSDQAIKKYYGLTLKSMVNIPYSLIAKEYSKIDSSSENKQNIKILEKQAKERVLAIINSIRYNKRGYFWINDIYPRMVMHPIFPDLDGKDISFYETNGNVVVTEKNKVPIFQEFVRITQEFPDKGGFVRYLWPDPIDKSKWVSKLSYVRLFKPWNWVIGTGIYVGATQIIAKKQAMEIIQTMRYNEDSYFWINDSQSKMLMHSTLSDLVGTDMSNFKQNGRLVTAEESNLPLFKQILNISKDSPQGDYIRYTWFDPGRKKSTKMAYVKFFEPWDWVIVATSYIDDIRDSVNKKRLALTHDVQNRIMLILMATLGIIFVNLIFVWFAAKFFQKSIKKVVDVIEGIFKGDLTRRLDMQIRKDEIGQFARLLNIGAKNLHKVMKNIALVSTSIYESSQLFKTTAKEMDSQAKEISLQSNTSAEATEKAASHISEMALTAQKISKQVMDLSASSNEISGNMMESGDATSNISNYLNTVAVASEQMSTSVNTVATSIEEMYSSLNEVAKNAGRGANVTQEASSKATQSSQIMNTLGEGAEEIGDVVNLIKDIAAQTNLLALNAAIEAAGAGEAGKGFAVVAGEVKELSRQTARATEEIRERVSSMQSNTIAAINAIEIIVEVISEINTIMTTIAASVEEQTTTTNEISKNISEAASAALSVSKNVSQAANNASTTADNLKDAIHEGQGVSMSISKLSTRMKRIANEAVEAARHTDEALKNVNGVNSAIKFTAKCSSNINSSSEDLTELAKQLDNMVKKFKI
ncbi:methyl-accepting chemotaxis protein [Candidatus Magnetomoraceae bacterium gMMP-1]